jgi:hypothetical protein
MKKKANIEVCRSEVIQAALTAGFMLGTQFGQDDKKLMPYTDTATLVEFVELLGVKVTQ